MLRRKQQNLKKRSRDRVPVACATCVRTVELPASRSCEAQRSSGLGCGSRDQPGMRGCRWKGDGDLGRVSWQWVGCTLLPSAPVWLFKGFVTIIAADVGWRDSRMGDEMEPMFLLPDELPRSRFGRRQQAISRASREHLPAPMLDPVRAHVVSRLKTSFVQDEGRRGKQGASAFDATNFASPASPQSASLTRQGPREFALALQASSPQTFSPLPAPITSLLTRHRYQHRTAHLSPAEVNIVSRAIHHGRAEPSHR